MVGPSPEKKAEVGTPRCPDLPLAYELLTNVPMPSRRSLPRQLLLFAATQKFITTSGDTAHVPPCWQHKSSYTSFTHSWPPLLLGTTTSLALLSNRKSFAIRICLSEQGAAISCGCSQKPSVSHSTVAHSQQSLGTQQSCGEGLGKGDHPSQGGQRGVSPRAQSQGTCSQAASPCRNPDLGPQLPAERLSSFPSRPNHAPSAFRLSVCISSKFSQQQVPFPSLERSKNSQN